MLLAASGPITAIPLLLFAAAARRLPLSLLGLMQYVVPSMQLCWGVAVPRAVRTGGLVGARADLGGGVALYSAEGAARSWRGRG